MQSKKTSLIEVICNVFTGLVIANLTWMFIVLPLAKHFGWGMYETRTGPIWITNGIFTVVSIVRSYFWRRTFNFLEKHYNWDGSE